MGNDPTREQVYHCGIPGDPSGAGVVDPGGATPTDQYVPKHNPAPWFHSLIDNPKDCANVVPLDGYPARRTTPRSRRSRSDLKSMKTTPDVLLDHAEQLLGRARRDLQGRQPLR